ncbi:DNA polymerase III subunit beta [Actinomadura harenae]|uniref:DNA polymerase III subunit beta n=1 Tax=Actinomadura harenae TaxID=2483351 RepID=UPI0013156455|nr:DNA polymerase III subunit beta [Actinomadura harenae]
MKFTIDAKAFADTIAWIARVLPSRPPVPVLAGIKVTATGGGVELAGFDYQVSARADLEAEVHQAGEALMSGRLLSDIARLLPAGPVQVVVENATCTLTTPHTTHTLLLMPTEDYPSLPEPPAEAGRIDAAAFTTAITQVTVAAGHDPTLPVLTGVWIELDSEKVIFAATDRFRLAVAAQPWTVTGQRGEDTLLVPAATLADLAKHLPGGADQLALGITRDGEANPVGLSITAGRRVLHTSLVDAKFIAWRKVLATSLVWSVVTDTLALATAVRRVAVVAERLAPVRLHCVPGDTGRDDGKLELRASTGDAASARETLSARVVADQPIDIAFNPGYLLDALTTTGTPQVCMRGSTDKPVLLLSMPTGASSEDIPVSLPDAGEPLPGQHRHLLMPIRLTG